MTNYCKLTETSPGVHGLPVVRKTMFDESVVLAGRSYRLSELTEAQRQGIGWATWSEEAVDTKIYVPGASVDALSASGVQRTYPNQTYRPLADLKKDKLALLALHRWVISNGGTTIGGNVFKTDDSSANEIDTALRQIERGLLTPPVKFTSSTSGNFQADQATLQTILNGIVGHRQAARAAEYAHAEAINALTTESAVVAYDYKANITGSAWPVNPTI
jgi:hypothetical protein